MFAKIILIIILMKMNSIIRAQINVSAYFKRFPEDCKSPDNFLTGTIQSFIELYGFITSDRSFHSNKISLTPGFTYQFLHYFFLVFGCDIWSINEFSFTNYITAYYEFPLSINNS